MTLSATTAPPIRQRWGVPRCGYYANAAWLAVARVSLPAAYVLAWLVAANFLLFVPRARRGSIAYLDRIHAPQKRWLPRRLWDTYRHLVEFGYLLIDRALMLARPRHGFRIQCAGLQNMAAASAADGPSTPPGVILLSAHFGNAEIGIPYLPQMGYCRPIHIVMYHEPDDAHERFHTRHRRLLADMDIISTTDPVVAGLGIMAALKQGDTVAMRADRTLAGKGLAVTLLGHAVVLPAGPFLAAVLSGAPVLYVYTCRLGYRRYACRFSAVHRYQESPEEPRAALLARAAQDFTSHLESLLREFPFQWSNFYDYWTEQAG
jgi:predicted LPLAT superfamily acyltransferase